MIYGGLKQAWCSVLYFWETPFILFFITIIFYELHTVTQNLQQSDGSRNNRAAAAVSMTEKLDKNHAQLISKNDLKHAMAYGCANSSDKALRKMVSTIMVSIWTREYMATHSIGGHKSPTDKTGALPKPKLDDDPFQAIICVSFLYLCYLLQTNSLLFITAFSLQF